MPTACVDPTLGNCVKGEFNSVGENSVQLCTNPCPPFVTLLTIHGIQQMVSCPCGTTREHTTKYIHLLNNNICMNDEWGDLRVIIRQDP